MNAERAPLRVLLVDDEPLARLRLRGLVEGCAEPPARVVAEAGDALSAVEALQRTPCDLVLLDIALPGRDGLKLADELRRLPVPPAVVFVSAHAEHALRAFDLDAADYLTKPVRRERLQAALLRAAQRLAVAAESTPPGAMLVVSDRGRVLRVPAAEVLYLKAEQKYVTLCSTRGRWLLDDALADLEQRLGAGFLRVHRNAVVAVASVRALARRGNDGGDAGDEHSADQGSDSAEGWAVQLGNGDWLAVSRRQLGAVRSALADRAR